MPFLTLLIVLLCLGLIGAALLVWLMARALVKPPRMSDAKAVWILKRLSPGDLDLPFEEVAFSVRDEQTGRKLRLAGWWIPASPTSGRCLVMLHGYADAKVGVLSWSPMFHRLGWNMLAIDLRAHGESEGLCMSQGVFERHDVSQAIDELRAQRPRDTEQLAVFGVSMGATVALAVAGMRDDVKGVILDSLLADPRTSSARFLSQSGMPGGPTARLAVWLGQRLCGADWGEVVPIRMVQRILCAMLVIEGGADAIVTVADREAIARAIRERPADAATADFWEVPEAGHLMGIVAEPDEYERRIGEFLRCVAGGPADFDKLGKRAEQLRPDNLKKCAQPPCI